MYISVDIHIYNIYTYIFVYIDIPRNICKSFFFFFLGLYLQKLDVSRLGVESELPLLAYTKSTATPDRSHICGLHVVCSNSGSLTHWARPGIESASSWTLCCVVNPLSHSGNSCKRFYTCVYVAHYGPEIHCFYLILKEVVTHNILCFVLVLFWLHPRHVEVPRLGIEPSPQQWPKLLQWQC